ncbi:amidase [Ammoniphilus sp. 3BR4]|uniref:amidase n=1 Tax=Ammoniphilus sp. 3BR4 TaxID=3158265 RepID=UPI003467DB5C
MRKWNMLFIGIILGMVIFPSPVGYTTEPADSSGQRKVLGTWLWNASTIETNGEGILAFLQKQQVNKLYLQISRKLSLQSYQTFIEQASVRGIEVFALDGAPNWASPGGERFSRQFFDWLKAYQQSSVPAQQFKGIQLDVEPYLDQGWKEDYQGTVFRYQDMIVASYTKARDMDLKFTLAVPFWFDNRSFSNSYGDGILAEWIILNSDEVVIMAYRDQAQQINPLVEQEVRWANHHSKQVNIAVETRESAEGDRISFYEEGSAYMHQQLEEVSGKYSQDVSFNGLAIHHLMTWMDMKP